MNAPRFVAVVSLCDPYFRIERILHVLGPFTDRTTAERAGRDAASAVDAVAPAESDTTAEYTVAPLWADFVDLIANAPDAPSGVAN